MGDAYSEWCNDRHEQEFSEQQAEIHEYWPEIVKLTDECLRERDSANMCFVKCCSTCGHHGQGRCYKLGYTRVHDLGTCNHWIQGDAVLCDDSNLDVMLLPAAKYRRRTKNGGVD